MICPKCNSKNEDSNIYCCKCGKKLTKNELNIKNETSNHLKSLSNNISKTLDKLLDNKKYTAIILTVMVGIISINVYICIHKKKSNTQAASINKTVSNTNINKPVQPKKSDISKEQIAAEKKIIDDYINKINNPTYTEYRPDSSYINSKLANNYFKSSYKKDAILLRAYGLAYGFLKDFNPKDTDSKNWPRNAIDFFTKWISYINPKDITGYHINSKKIFPTIQKCAKKIYNMSLEDWHTIYIDRKTLTSDEWNLKYGRPQEPEIGMTKEEVLHSTWGNPQNVHTTTSQYGTHEQWVYSSNRYIYFEDGVVTTIQN